MEKHVSGVNFLDIINFMFPYSHDRKAEVACAKLKTRTEVGCQRYPTARTGVGACTLICGKMRLSSVRQTGQQQVRAISR